MFSVLTPKGGTKPPSGSVSDETSARASAMPIAPPITEITSPSLSTSRKIVRARKPSVRITAISVVRSRTAMAIVLPATNSVVITTASAMLPSSRSRLPNIDANVVWNAFSVSVFVS